MSLSGRNNTLAHRWTRTFQPANSPHSFTGRQQPSPTRNANQQPEFLRPVQMRFHGPVVPIQPFGHILGPNRPRHLLRFGQRPIEIRFGELKHLPHSCAR